MARTIILDSAPLGLLVHQGSAPSIDQCRAWAAEHLVQGAKFIIPEIVDYELRRELTRTKKAQSIQLLDALYSNQPEFFLALHTRDLRLAALLWAEVRNRGLPTAHPHDLDIDVILSAQALNLGLQAADYVVATSNVAHLKRFVPCELWEKI